MNDGSLKNGLIRVELYVRDDCCSCGAVQEALEVYCRDKHYLLLTVVDLDHGGTPAPERQAFITPALWVNDSLWNLGRFDLTRFDERIKRLAYDLGTSGSRD